MVTHHEEEALLLVLLEDVLAPRHGLVDEGGSGVADQNAEGFVILELGDHGVALHQSLHVVDLLLDDGLALVLAEAKQSLAQL